VKKDSPEKSTASKTALKKDSPGKEVAAAAAAPKAPAPAEAGPGPEKKNKKRAAAEAEPAAQPPAGSPGQAAAPRRAATSAAAEAALAPAGDAAEATRPKRTRPRTRPADKPASATDESPGGPGEADTAAPSTADGAGEKATGPRLRPRPPGAGPAKRPRKRRRDDWDDDAPRRRKRAGFVDEDEVEVRPKRKRKRPLSAVGAVLGPRAPRPRPRGAKRRRKPDDRQRDVIRPSPPLQPTDPLAAYMAGEMVPCPVGCGGFSEIVRVGTKEDGAGEVWFECLSCAQRQPFAVPKAQPDEIRNASTAAEAGEVLCPRHPGRMVLLRRRGRQLVCPECGVRFTEG
jgi:hypothetical protein